MQEVLQVSHRNLIEMEDRSCESRVCMSELENIYEVLHAAGATRGDDRDGELFMQTVECLIGKALLRTVMIHRGKKDLSCTTLLSLMCPFEEHTLRWHAATIQVAAPLTIIFKTCINGTDTLLTAEALGNLGLEPGMQNIVTPAKELMRLTESQEKRNSKLLQQ